MILAGLEDLPVLVQVLIGLLTVVAVVAVAWPVARSNWVKSTAAVWKEHSEALEARIEDLERDLAETNKKASAAERKAEAMDLAHRMVLRDAMGVDAIEHLAKQVATLRTEVTAQLQTLITIQRSS